MAERYIKPALSFEAQVGQLARRGMLFNDRAAAARTLTHVNYYRLSAYWPPFKRPDDYRISADTRWVDGVMTCHSMDVKPLNYKDYPSTGNPGEPQFSPLTRCTRRVRVSPKTASLP